MARFLVAVAMVVAVLAFVAVGEVQADGTVYTCEVVGTIGADPLSLTVFMGHNILNVNTGETQRSFTGTATAQGRRLTAQGVHDALSNAIISDVVVSDATVNNPFLPFVGFVRLTWTADPVTDPTATATGQAILISGQVITLVIAVTISTATCTIAVDP